MSNIVVIPTAGLGSRMGELTQFLNKALLPYKGKPVLAHIIDQFPNDTNFIIPVGYKSDQIIDFCALVYPEKNIEFVHIPNYTESFTGPGYTIKQCLDNINGSFYYIPCDTYFNEGLPLEHDEDTYYVKKVDTNMNYHYTTFNVDNGRLVDYKFKEYTPDNYYAFTGVMYIKDHIAFKNRLLSLSGPEIIYTIELNSNVNHLYSWIDFGNLEEYKAACNKSQKYDFTKTDEITYLCNNKVVKYWKADNIAHKKFVKHKTNIEVYPSNTKQLNNWLCYDYFEGDTLYNHNNYASFPLLMQWLDNKVWIKSQVDLRADAHDFYKVKTLDRVYKFVNKHKNLPTPTHVNDVPVKDYRYYLGNINWEMLYSDLLAGYTHGDLQFDNLIISTDKTFRVIDWRHEFGTNVEYGDIYYDLAKLYGGFIIDYSKIKQNSFEVREQDSKIYLDIPNINDYNFYTSQLINYIRYKRYNEYKVRLLVPIIFWNMAPLHHEPFDKFLWYLGMMMFEEAFKHG